MLHALQMTNFLRFYNDGSLNVKLYLNKSHNVLFVIEERCRQVFGLQFIKLFNYLPLMDVADSKSLLPMVLKISIHILTYLVRKL
jgi:hypothetical protein